MINRRELSRAFTVAVAGVSLAAGCSSTSDLTSDGGQPNSGSHTSFPALRQIDAGALSIGYAETGPAGRAPVVLLHGWPHDIYSYVDVAPLLAASGYRVIVPYLRHLLINPLPAHQTPPMRGSAINHADVLIIGGASGAVAAKCLAETGLYVMCLEPGEWPDRATFPGTQLDWELSGLQQWSADPPMFARRPGDYPIDVTDSDMSIMNFNGVGGGTIISVGRVYVPIGYPGQRARPVMPQGFPGLHRRGTSRPCRRAMTYLPPTASRTRESTLCRLICLLRQIVRSYAHAIC
jgi:hypothetical protein